MKLSIQKSRGTVWLEPELMTWVCHSTRGRVTVPWEGGGRVTVPWEGGGVSLSQGRVGGRVTVPGEGGGRVTVPGEGVGAWHCPIGGWGVSLSQGRVGGRVTVPGEDTCPSNQPDGGMSTRNRLDYTTVQCTCTMHSDII